MHITALDFPVFISLPSHDKLMSVLYFMQTPNRYAKKSEAVLSHSSGCRSLEKRQWCTRRQDHGLASVRICLYCMLLLLEAGWRIV